MQAAKCGFALLVVGGVIVACQSSSSTAPGVATGQCGGSTVTIPVSSALIADCSAATTLTLAGNGANYLVVPQFATDTGSITPISYTISASGGVVASAFPGSAPVSLASFSRPATATVPAAKGPGARQRAFDGAVLAHARSISPASRRRVSSSRPSFLVAPPAVGSTRQFQVLSSTTFNRYTTITGQLAFAGTNVLLYIDVQAPSNGFTSSQLQGFGQLFDQTLYPIDTTTFGTPTDLDANGRLIMLMTPVVNALTPAANCAQSGYIGGFFNPTDLVNSSNSNQGEIFYSIVPDPSGSANSCPHTVNDLLNDEPAVFLHELQHLINFSQHFVVHGGEAEQGWLDEGMSIVAEELGSIYYENRFPPPTGRTSSSQLFPDSSQGFINTLLDDSYNYLFLTDTATVTLHTDADPGLAWRGGDWLLLRWLGDQKGSGVYRALEQGRTTGGVNIATAANESFQTLFGDFSLALYTDSLPGIPRTSIPTRDRFVSRTLRKLYQRLFDTDPQDFPRAYPVVPKSLVGSVTTSMLPGTMSFYRVNTGSSATTVTIQFSNPGGSVISLRQHPQLSIFRLP